MAELLLLEDVVAGYGDAIVLDRVSLSIDPGQTLTVLGRNGVGKSTLLSTIVGRTRLHGGRIRYGNSDLSNAPRWRRARLGIGLVPQEREVFPSLTVEENLHIAHRGTHWSLDRIYDLFPALAQRRRHYGNELSGGEQQMLAIGRALVGNPSLILLDEPLEGLAPVIVEMLMAVLQKLRGEGGLSILLVEQHARLALTLAEQAIVLDRGRIVYQGPSSTLLEDSERMQSLLGVAG
jgi:branched-chain amino acid transport system ATP-binding protein